MSTEYHPGDIERKWQRIWAEQQRYACPSRPGKPSYYVLDMFPYPSGEGLHVGHIVGYTASDVVARFKRLQGYEVLHPMGWDAFGLPAEQFALKKGVPPQQSMRRNIDIFRTQLQRVGLSYDWQREINTTDPKFYRWTQWLFKRLWEKGLAYQSYAPVNWCPALGTVLANEEVSADGRSEVGNHPVEKRPVRQWVLKITAYAEQLLAGLDDLDWPESTKEMQRHWIGRREGCEVIFPLQGATQATLQVFTTRADTLFGVTFCAVAPEHPLLEQLTTPDQATAVKTYVAAALRRAERDRQASVEDKTGVFTGGFVCHPLSQQPIPVYVADYVLGSYGTGAVMGVPAHDARDFAFAHAHGIDIRVVITSSQETAEGAQLEHAFTAPGVLVNSQQFTGQTSETAKQQIAQRLTELGLGQVRINYRLRDWIFSRQRYWGEPFPLIHTADGQVIAVADHDLPVTLPEVADFRPTADGEPPLSKATTWVDVPGYGRREVNIMPQWAGSCWYYLRFLDPHNPQQPWDLDLEKAWMPVDLYIGGVEHANLHLLYARFWHKVLFDLGMVSTPEPFAKLRHPGLILGSDGEKMSKSRGNVVNPLELVDAWGADTLRLHELFLGPFDQPKPWNTEGISGVFRFIKRFWRLVVDPRGQIGMKFGPSTLEFKRLTHKTIAHVVADTERLAFNTAIAALMSWVNEATKQVHFERDLCRQMLILLSCYAPHVASELWERLGEAQPIETHDLPHADASLIRDETLTYPVMINGKLRSTVEVDAGASEVEVMQRVWQDAKVMAALQGKTPKRTVFVGGKVVNLVI